MRISDRTYGRRAIALAAVVLILAGCGFVFAEDGTDGSGSATTGSALDDARTGMVSRAPDEPSITFDAMGGVCDSTSKTVVFGRKYDEMPVPTMDGFVFGGWHTKRDRGARVLENSRVKTRSDTVYYARWIPKGDYRKVRGLPILMYHWFYDKNAGGTGANGNWLDIDMFRAHMAYLRDNQYKFPTWREVEAFVTGKMALPPKSVVITDDDGDDSFFALALPVIKQYNVDVTSFLITSAKGRSTVEGFADERVRYRSHSHNMHRGGQGGKGLFLSLGREEALKDLRTSVDELGGKAEVFCYPFGHHNEKTAKILDEAGFRLAVTTEFKRAYPGTDRYALPRVRVSAGESLESFISSVK
ncbi:MAG: polysaccharide deacetylase family protein [Clostridiales Family XIII bacterium]|jgi:peptidoglycan/xylan/chitin deacetylase (PgdA/CDA1 family)|nr:polysaccharide deacetylase family protein [Clostridiales Family XIII bacterium]